VCVIILPHVLCGCETWSLILKEKHGLRVFEVTESRSQYCDWLGVGEFWVRTLIGEQIFSFPHPSGPVLGPNQSPVFWVPGFLLGGKAARTRRLPPVSNVAPGLGMCRPLTELPSVPAAVCYCTTFSFV
jgi:hypothetical protein